MKVKKNPLSCFPSLHISFFISLFLSSVLDIDAYKSTKPSLSLSLSLSPLSLSYSQKSLTHNILYSSLHLTLDSAIARAREGRD